MSQTEVTKSFKAALDTIQDSCPELESTLAEKETRREAFNRAMFMADRIASAVTELDSTHSTIYGTILRNAWPVGSLVDAVDKIRFSNLKMNQLAARRKVGLGPRMEYRIAKTTTKRQGELLSRRLRRACAALGSLIGSSAAGAEERQEYENSLALSAGLKEITSSDSRGKQPARPESPSSSGLQLGTIPFPPLPQDRLDDAGPSNGESSRAAAQRRTSATHKFAESIKSKVTNVTNRSKTGSKNGSH